MGDATKGNATVRDNRVFFSSARECPRVVSLTVARHPELVELPSWLDGLPQSSSLCVHLCLKGILCDGNETRNAVAGLKKIHLHSCVEEPGGSANGHEGVCAFRFLLDNYERRDWQHVYFAHADVHGPKHRSQFRAMKSYLAQASWPIWPKSLANMTSEHCGCVGTFPSHPPLFGPSDFWWKHITWWLGNFVALADQTAHKTSEEWSARAECTHGGCSRAGFGAYLLNNGTWASPIGFMFGVDRASALQRSKPWLAAQYRMNKKGVRVLPPGMSGASRASWLPSPGFDFAPLPWAHVNERLPFVLFGAEFVERQVPPCVLVGNHATQNCSYNNAPGLPVDTGSKGLKHHEKSGIVESWWQRQATKMASDVPLPSGAYDTRCPQLRAVGCPVFKAQCGTSASCSTPKPGAGR